VLHSSNGPSLYDVRPDGQGFIAVRPEASEVAPLQIVMVPDFVQSMKSRFSGRKAQP